MLFGIIVHIHHFGIKAIIAIGHDADAANHHAILVERKAARIGGQAKRRTLRADERAADTEPRRQIGTGQLTELHAIKRAGFKPHRARGRREVRLHDHRGRAGGKGVAARRQIGAGDGLGDRGQFRRHRHALRVDIGAVGVGPRGGGRAGAGHAIDGKHIADPINHGDHCRQIAGRSFGGGAGNDRLHVGDAQRLLRRLGEHTGRRWRWRRAWGGIDGLARRRTAAATASQQERKRCHPCRDPGAAGRHFRPRNRPAICASAPRNAAGSQRLASRASA